jgi:hypothetical protein
MAEALHHDAVLLLGGWQEELREMFDRLEQIESDAEDFGLLAVAHKVREAMGPLSSAQRACPQYLDGTLEVS